MSPAQMTDQETEVRNFPTPLPSLAPAVELQGSPQTAPAPAQEPGWTFDPTRLASLDSDERDESPHVVPSRKEEFRPLRSQVRTEEAHSVLPSLGPTGKSRFSFGVVLFSVLTLGIYALVWHYKVNREMAEFDPSMDVAPGRSTWGVALPWLVSVGAALFLGAQLVVSRLNIALTFTTGLTNREAEIGLAIVAVGVQYLLLLLPFSAVSVVMTAERIRIVQERGGLARDEQCHPTRMLWWLMLPVVGGLSLMVSEQRKLNAVWEIVAPPRRRSSSSK